MFIDCLRNIFRKYLLQFLQGSLLDGLYTFEVLQKLCPAFFSNTGNLIQNRGFHMSGLELTMILNGKAVGLFLNLPNQCKDRRDGLNADFPPIRVNQRTGTVPVILHHTKGRDIQVQRLLNAGGYLHMLMTSVDKQQIRFFRKLFISIQITAKASGKHLLHRSVIVWPLHIL